MKSLHQLNSLIDLLSSLKTKPKKSLSQNFLIDKNIIDKFIKALHLKKEDVVLEIGPGPGAITTNLLKAQKIIAIEKDDTLAKNLKDLKHENLDIKNIDFLNLDLNFLKNYNKKIKVISSIPYHLTKPIIFKLLNNHYLFSTIVLIIQKEVANKIIAPINTKKYSSFSTVVNLYADIKIVSHISRNSFFPKPNVDSTIIELKIKDSLQNTFGSDLEIKKFKEFILRSFKYRRKKLISNLQDFYPKNTLIAAFESLRIDLNIRAQSLTLDDFLILYKKLLM